MCLQKQTTNIKFFKVKTYVISINIIHIALLSQNTIKRKEGTIVIDNTLICSPLTTGKHTKFSHNKITTGVEAYINKVNVFNF